MHRTKVRVVEDALDANNTIARANRDDFDRAGVTVVNLMSAPGAGKTTLLERVARATSTACASGVLEGDVQGSLDADRLALAARAGHAAQHRRRASAASATSTRTWCARRCPTLPLDEHRPAGDRERRQPRLPGRVPGRRGRARDGLLGHRGRGQAAQVPADVPRLRAGAGQQDRPAAAPRLRPRPVRSHNLEAVQPGRRARCSSARGPARASTRGATGWSACRRAARRRRRDASAVSGRRSTRASTSCSRGGRRPTSGSSRPRPSASRGCATAMAERFARGGRLVALGRLARGALGRAPRRGRVRPPGDRRQAGAAGDRARRARAGRSPRRSSCVAEPDDIAIAFGPASARSRTRSRSRARARLPDDRLRARRRRVGVRAAERRPVRRARSWSRRSTTCSGSSCTCSSSTAACSRAATRGRCTTPAPRASSTRSSPSARPTSRRCVADVRALGR